METLIMTPNDADPSMHSGPVRAAVARPTVVRDAVSVYQTAAWRAPGVTRFDSRPANDFLARADAIAPRTLSAEPVESRPMPRWIIFAVGVVVAALLGAFLGGALAV